MLQLRYMLSQIFSLNFSLYVFLKYPVLQSFQSLLFLKSLSLSIFVGSCLKHHKNVCTCFRMQWCRKFRTCNESDISITTTTITKRFCMFSIIFITGKEKIFKFYVTSKITISIVIIKVRINWLVSIKMKNEVNVAQIHQICLYNLINLFMSHGH